MCMASSIDSTNSPQEDNTSFTPHNETAHNIRLVAARTNKLFYGSLNHIEICYFGHFYRKYNNTFLSSIGFMQEFGYTHIISRNSVSSEPVVYGIIGMETGIYDNVYFDFYFGLYPIWIWVVPGQISGIRSGYKIPFNKYIKLDVGGRVDFRQNGQLYRIYVGFIFF